VGALVGTINQEKRATIQAKELLQTVPNNVEKCNQSEELIERSAIKQRNQKGEVQLIRRIKRKKCNQLEESKKRSAINLKNQ
jgi:competence protein ComGF